MTNGINDLLLALSLSADAFVVCIALGLQTRPRLTHQQRVIIPVWFGLAQAVMPLLGWLGMSWLSGWTASLTTGIACTILLLIGGKMLWPKREDQANTTLAGWLTVFSLGIATSIDALLVGFSIAALSDHPTTTIVLIGCVTTAVCLGAMYAARHIPNIISQHAERIAGTILILLGCKLLISAWL